MNKKNKKFFTGFDEDTGLWYALDNAALLMPAIAGQAATYLFRISFELTDLIKLPILQQALAKTSRRFPYFTVELRHGLFWHYMEPHKQMPIVEKDSIFPCQAFAIFQKGRCLYRVRARSNTIACEFFHVITDGTGGLRFMKNLVAEYYRLQGIDVNSSDPELYNLYSKPSPEEYEDAYKKSCPDTYPRPEKESRAYHIQSKMLPRGNYRITNAITSLSSALGKAKQYGVTLTELLSAIYIDTLQTIWFNQQLPQKKRSKIVLEIPVNMRKFFTTSTNRNFSLLVRLDQDTVEGERDFHEILKRVHHQLRLKLDKKSLLRQIFRNVSGENILAVRILPLFIKSLLMKYLFLIHGDNCISGILSNLGSVNMPEVISNKIKNMQVILAPNPGIKTLCGVISWKDNLNITFGSLAFSRDIERLFIKKMISLGLKVKVECNLSEEA